VKGWQVPQAIETMRPLMGPETVVVPLLNGVEAPDQLMLHNKLLRAVQAHLLGFSTGIMLSWKRFCSFCLFHTSHSVAGCLVQLVYTNFPNRVRNSLWASEGKRSILI
jgi:hypothetical protein